MYYTSQRAYTNIVWEKLEEENYETLLKVEVVKSRRSFGSPAGSPSYDLWFKENPFKHSIVGDVAAAANAHRDPD